EHPSAHLAERGDGGVVRSRRAHRVGLVLRRRDPDGLHGPRRPRPRHRREPGRARPPLHALDLGDGAGSALLLARGESTQRSSSGPGNADPAGRGLTMQRRRQVLKLLGYAAVAVQILPLAGCASAEELPPPDSLAVTSSRRSKLGEWVAHTHLLYVP